MKNNPDGTWLKQTSLENEWVKLVPLTHEFREQLVAASNDGNLSNLWFTGVPNEQSMDSYLETALSAQSQGLALPFVVLSQKTLKVLGCTRYCHANAAHRRIEIGYTWYRKSVQKSAINTACKLLLLEHAFEQLNAIAVEFRTHWHNQASRAAIARLGAKQDGIIRNAAIEPDGAYRDTVLFSIIASEWPSVKKSLMHKLMP